MLSLKKVLLTAIASFLAFAILAGIFADLLLLMLGLTGESFDMYMYIITDLSCIFMFRNGNMYLYHYP